MSSGERLNCLEVIQRCTGIRWHHTINHYSDRRWRYQGPCPTGHDTQTFGFYVSEDQQHFWCFGACGTHGNAHRLQELLTNQPADYRPPPVKTSSRPKAAKAPPPGATLEQLARAKGLDPQWFNDVLKWRNGFWFNTRAVEIPYFDQNRRRLFLRYRVCVSGGDTYRWP